MSIRSNRNINKEKLSGNVNLPGAQGIPLQIHIAVLDLVGRPFLNQKCVGSDVVIERKKKHYHTNLYHEAIRKKGFGPGETQVALGNFYSPKEYLALWAAQVSLGVSGCL